MDYRCGADQDKPLNFRYLRHHIDNLKFKNVFDKASDYHKLVLLQLKNSSLGNRFITSPAYLAYFENKFWYYLILRRIGHYVVTQKIPCPICRSNILMDRYGNHAASCSTGRHRIRRHDYLRNILSELL